MSTPNLFRHAPSELSQDAFLCWLLEWADKSNEAANAALHRIARQFVEDLWDCGRPGESRLKDFSTVTVERQVDKVDFVVKLDEESLIAIEDKVHSGEHDNQLVRYRKAIEARNPGATIALVYLKTGDESRYVAAESAGYGVYPRAKLLQLLDRGRKDGVTSDIYCDFNAHLQRLEDEVRAYETTPVAKWAMGERCWVGFFQELQGRLDRAEWGAINNPQGECWCLWWYGHENLYLALHEGELRFKATAESGADRRAVWEAAHRAVMESAGELKLKRPKRQRDGADMTVAILEGDYRAADSNGVICVEGTLKNLKQAEAVLMRAAELLPKSQTASRE